MATKKRVGIHEHWKSEEASIRVVPITPKKKQASKNGKKKK